MGSPHGRLANDLVAGHGRGHLGVGRSHVLGCALGEPERACGRTVVAYRHAALPSQPPMSRREPGRHGSRLGLCFCRAGDEYPPDRTSPASRIG